MLHFSSTLIFISVRKWLRVNLTLFLLWEKICAFTWNSSSISHRFWTWTCHFIDNNRKKNWSQEIFSFLTNVCVIFTRNSELEKCVTRKLVLTVFKTDLRKKELLIICYIFLVHFEPLFLHFYIIYQKFSTPYHLDNNEICSWGLSKLDLSHQYFSHQGQK